MESNHRPHSSVKPCIIISCVAVPVNLGCIQSSVNQPFEQSIFLNIEGLLLFIGNVFCLFLLCLWGWFFFILIACINTSLLLGGIRLFLLFLFPEINGECSASVESSLRKHYKRE